MGDRMIDGRASVGNEQDLRMQKQRDAGTVDEIIEEKDREGRTVKNKYIKSKLLGKGGFAKCYLGIHLPGRTQYALKIVSKSTLTKPRAKQKLQSEIKIHRNLRHMHVVRFDKFFEDKQSAYMLLELCKNNSMSELMKRRKRLTEPEVRYYILQLTSALTYLHDSYIIHRDLKLGNIFLDSHMRVKVGDFGLATKLSHPDERRKTVCGTPNYIAPEILNGKVHGHSFEVDIWSTGIIIYTLLVGKPPYEAENVDATYQRILENRYSFPPTCSVSDHARSLIQEILQLKPTLRPSLLCIESSPFFTAPGLYTPSALSSAAMREAPAMCVASGDVSKATSDGSTKARASHVAANDENDPLAANRMRSQPVAHHLHMASPPRKVLASSEQQDGLESAGGARTHLNRGRASSTSRGLPRRGVCTTTARSDRSESSGRIRKTRSSLSTSATNTTAENPSSQAQTSRRGLQTHQRYVSGTASVADQQEKRGYVRQFEVYNDTKSAASKALQQVSGDIILKRPKPSRADSSNKLLHPTGVKRYTSTYDDDETVDTATESELATHERGAVGSSCDAMSNHPMEECEDEVVKEIQQNMEQFGIRSTEDKPVSTASAPKTAWTMEETSDAPKKVSAYDNDEGAAEKRSTAYTTPAASRPTVVRHPDTLECMYKNLESSFAEQDSRGHGHVDTVCDTANAPKVWVVRHVDYTSKYGLGFLLNTGSAGVYFNDSTKIVLSRDGNMFQYIERKRRASSGAVEHSVQTYSLATFPSELTKKVTLLKHFKNYLLDQMQQSGAAGEAQMIFQQGIEAAAGHGTLSASPAEGTAFEGGDLPYVKKWVRTRHAILFRLSNRTVQVVFFDQSEVILSAEARVVSFLSKDGIRSDHTLEAVFNSGRSDIEKRIKYTKDIMARLINLQPQQREEN